MSPKQLIVRCMARREGDLWVAVCLDFTLAAQASTLPEARKKLHKQIESYVREAFTVDKAHAVVLLSRKAPLWHRFIFEVCRLYSRIKPAAPEQAYEEALPLKPAFA